MKKKKKKTYLWQLIKFIRRNLQQLCCSLTCTPAQNLGTLICKGDLQIEGADDFTITSATAKVTHQKAIGFLIHKLSTMSV